MILLLERIKLVYQVKRARVEDIEFAKDYMRRLHDKKVPEVEQSDSEEIIPWTGPMWTRSAIEEHVKKFPTGCFIILDDYFVDASSYMGSHVITCCLLSLTLIIDILSSREELGSFVPIPFALTESGKKFFGRMLRGHLKISIITDVLPGGGFVSWQLGGFPTSNYFITLFFSCQFEWVV